MLEIEYMMGGTFKVSSYFNDPNKIKYGTFLSNSNLKF